ncbi:NAD binding oxidoreductase [Cryomyces antarcticus]
MLFREVRFGVLSAALINPTALFDPVRTHPDAVIVPVAARELAKAQAQATKYGIPRAYDIDAVYIPLPNSLHCEWAIKAMGMGKHVLIEKPIASNADEARQILACAKETGRVALEAFHWQFHPAAHVVKSLVDSGRYGSVLFISTSLYLPVGTMPRDDIRFKYDLAGGACMDLAYVFSATRYYIGPAECDIVASMRATLLFRSSSEKPAIVADTVTIELEKATITFTGFVAPHFFHKITHYSFGPEYQLEAFVSKIRGEEPNHWIALEESVAVMECIDLVYEKAGMKKRGL